MTGATIGTWMIGAEIGRGPHGIVYRAQDAENPLRLAAVKVLTHEMARTPEFLARFPGEMLALQRLNHPNVAKFFDSGVHAGAAYYASELVAGTDLAALLKSARTGGEPGLGWRDAGMSVAVQAARALKHGHHRSILHRDLKPSNVLLTADGVLKLTDFGVGRLLAVPPHSLPPDPFGTAGFLAPEFFTGKPFTRRSDLYSLGCVLYAAVCGRPPFLAATAAEFMHKHCYALPDRPSRFVPKLPPDLDDLICALVQKDPARRPPTAAAVIEELGNVRGKCERKGERVAWPEADGDGTGPAPAVDAAEADDDTTWARPRPPLSRPLVVVPLFLLVVAVGLAFWMWPRPTAKQLYERAAPLLETDSLDDWERAWDESLQPLQERYPTEYAEQVRAARIKIADRKKLLRSVDAGERLKPTSEAERLYLRGLALAEAGDAAGARRVWAGCAAGFAGSEDGRWADASAAGFAEIDRRVKVDPSGRLAQLAAALERVGVLRREGRAADADALLGALADAHRDDTIAADLIRQARGKK